jgi:hypothetical protein
MCCREFIFIIDKLENRIAIWRIWYEYQTLTERNVNEYNLLDLTNWHNVT